MDQSASTPNSAAVMAERLENQIYYTVSTFKAGQEIYVTYNGIQLYDNHGAEVIVQADITVTSDKFSYWDTGNTCPALSLSAYQWTENGTPTGWGWYYGGTLVKWSDGGIYTGNDPHDEAWYMSG